MVEQFKKVRDNPVPTAVFVTCVDSRMLPTRFTQTNVGDMFIVRNAGNMVPHSSLVSSQSTATEPAVLELACVMNSVEHIVVCGHSDCKAMNLLYSMHTDEPDEEALNSSPLRYGIYLRVPEALRILKKMNVLSAIAGTLIYQKSRN